MTGTLHKYRAARFAALAALAASLMWSATTVTAGDDAQRIEFARGTDSATVQGSTPPGTTDRWVLRAAAGQTMTVNLGPDEFAALTTIFGPNGDVVGAGHTSATVNLPATGDYVIDVGNTGSTSDYTMTVRIPPLQSPPTTSPPPSPTNCTLSTSQRIEFAPGTDNATVQGSVAPGTIACYVLRASAGQTMTVSLGPDEFAALTTIVDPNGNVVGAGHTSATAHLPATGDYVIDVGNTGTTTEFSMNVRIPAVSTPTTAPTTAPPAQLPATR
jgi:hypothetical protein